MNYHIKRIMKSIELGSIIEYSLIILIQYVLNDALYSFLYKIKVESNIIKS